MNPISDKNLSRAGKSIVWIMFLGGLFYYALSKFGIIGMNLGGIEQIILIALGLFLLSETVLEDKAKLKRMNPIVTVEALLGLLITVYGVSLLVGQASVTTMLNPYIQYMVVVGAVFAVLEGTTKI